jgi:hypothetical protein
MNHPVSSLLSFVPLAARSTILGFARDELGRLDPDRRARLRSYAVALMRRSDVAPAIAYAPVERTDAARRAVVAVNLLLLALAAGDGPIELSALLDQSADPVDTWRRLVLSWRSTLGGEEWRDVADAVCVERADDGEAVWARVRLATDPDSNPHGDSQWLTTGTFHRYAHGQRQWLTVEYFHQYLTRYRSAYPAEVGNALVDIWIECDIQLGDLVVLLGLEAGR